MQKNEMILALENDLELAIQPYYDDLSRIKGFSVANVKRAITIIVTAVLLIGPTSWAQATPSERKAAVVNVANRKIDLPWFGESVEAIAIGLVYDLVALRLLG